MTVSLAFQSVLSALPVAVETASNVTARLRVSKEFFYNFCTPSSPGFSLSTLGTRWKISPMQGIGFFPVACSVTRNHSEDSWKRLIKTKWIPRKVSISVGFLRRGIRQLLSPKSYLQWFPNTIKLNTLLSTFIMSGYVGLRRRKAKRWYRFFSCLRLRCAQAIWLYRI